MSRALKITLSIAAIIVIIIAGLGFIANRLLDPETLKPMIAKQVKNMTGRDLNIHGKLHWTLIPTISIQVSGIELSNPDDFQNTAFATVGEVEVAVKLFPLFEKKIVPTKLIINDVNVTLLENKVGQNNWTFEGDASDTTSKTQAKNQDDAAIIDNEQLAAMQQNINNKPSQSSPKEDGFSITAIPNVAINNVSVSYQNEQTNAHYSLTNLNINAKNIHAGDAFPATFSFNFDSSNPNIKGTIDFSSDVSFDNAAKTLALKNILLKTKTAADNRKAQTTNITGDIDLLSIKDNRINFTLNIDQLNLDTLLPDTSKTNTSTQKKSDHAKTSTQTSNKQSGDGPYLDGKLTVGKLTAQKMHLTDLTVSIQAKNGFYRFAPITAKAYQGDIKAHVLIDTRKSKTAVSLNTALSNIQTAELLQDLTGSAEISGVANIKTDIKTSGVTDQDYLSNLNGTINFSINNGSLKALDIISQIQKAANLIKLKNSDISTSSSDTSFGTLNGNADIKNGVATTAITLDANVLNANGSGTVNLINKKLHMAIDAQYTKNDALKDYMIPLIVSGTYDDPQVSVDNQKLANTILKAHGKNVEEELNKRLKKLDVGDKLKGLF